MVQLASLAVGVPKELPPHPGVDSSVPHAPRRPVTLSPAERELAVRNALRYFPEEQHATLMPEFVQELDTLGHIYCHRLRPLGYPMKAHPLSAYPCKTRQAASIILMIQNNLDPAVAQFPHELVTYGGNGTVFSNWAQYAVAMRYLCEMSEEQTLVLCAPAADRTCALAAPRLALPTCASVSASAPRARAQTRATRSACSRRTRTRRAWW